MELKLCSSCGTDMTDMPLASGFTVLCLECGHDHGRDRVAARFWFGWWLALCALVLLIGGGWIWLAVRLAG